VAVQGRSQPRVPPGGRDAGWGRGTRQGRSNTAHIAHLIQKRFTVCLYCTVRRKGFGAFFTRERILGRTNLCHKYRYRTARHMTLLLRKNVLRTATKYSSELTGIKNPQIPVNHKSKIPSRSSTFKKSYQILYNDEQMR
jgi:hypothetical protein